MINSIRQQTCSRARRQWCPSTPGLVAGASLAVAITFGALAQPVPISDASFSEGGGLTTTNAGSLSGSGTLAQQGGFPAFVQNSPVGPYAPSGNGGSIDFGTITASQDGARGVDFPGKLGALNGFTLCGWVNCRDLSVGWGGNRIVFGLVGPNGNGFDLVHLGDGSLQLGINQWPDGSPATSSPGRITADPNTGVDNWVFLALSYDGTAASDQVNYYFGNANTPATLDVTRTYNRGPLPDAGTLTVGNFGTVAGARNETGPGGFSRCFRGLFDEIKVYSSVLTLEQIQAAQTNAALPQPPIAFVSEPVDRAILAGQDATFAVSVTGGFPIQYRWQRNEQDIPDATNASYTVVGATEADSGARFRVFVSNPINNLTSSNATLYVNSDGTPPVVAGITALNRTNLLVSYSEPVDLGAAEDPSNYVLGDGSLNIYSAVLQPNLTNVLMTTDLMTTGAVYTLNIQNVSDRALPFANMMDPTNVVFTAYTTPPVPTPIVETRFEEGSGNTVMNSGSAGGLGAIDFGLASSAAGLPGFVSNVPTGPYAPAGNTYALSFGTSAGHAPYAGKAVDFPDSVRTNTVGLTQFTLTGWINVTDGNIGGGGNRIFSTWPQNVNNNNDNLRTGVELVMESGNRLRLGINQAPDYPTPPSGPYSSGLVTISPTADPANWIFFAISYDASLSANQVTYYFGKPDTLAAVDVSATYPRGMIANCSVPVTLTLGNFMDVPPLVGARDSTSSSRAFRGLMDEIRFFGNALTLEQVQEVQTKGAPVIITPLGFAQQPVSQTLLEGQSVTFSVIVTGTPPISVQWQRNGTDIPGATALNYTIPAVSVADNGVAFSALASNANGSLASSNAILTVIQDLVAPTVLDVAPARSARNLTNLTVQFSEPVDAGSAQDPGNYALDDGNRTTYSAVLQPDLTTVVLVIDALTPDATHTLAISGVSDRAGTPNVMTATNWTFSGPPSRLPAIVEFRFEEGAGTVATNSGSLGGSATIVQQTGYPVFSTNVPTGTYAPAGDMTSIDFGNIAAGEGARAVDLTTATGPNGTVGAMDAFTVCGWVNARDLNEGWGGNRLAFALSSGNGPGFDVVQLADGSLRLGVNEWPDNGATGGGPRSSAGKITADLTAGPANWVFFAVTYDSSVNNGEASYYFGKPDQAAELDMTAPYARGPIVTSGKLTVGNFSTIDTGARNGLGPSGPSRVFRGLIDELQVFEEALSLERLRQIQQSAPAAPKMIVQRDSNQIVISWTTAANYQLQYRTQINQGDWVTETAAPEVTGNTRTVRVQTTETTRFYRLISQ